MQFSKADFQDTAAPTKADFGAPSSNQSTISKADFEQVKPTTSVHLPGQLRPDIQTQIDQVATARGIPVWALRAIARQESGGLPHPETAASPAGAQGVMQMMPDTFRSISPRGNIVSLKDNIVAGATYYQTLLKKYGDPVKAAGAYNMGPGAFDEYLAGKRNLPAETVAYMANVAAMHTPINETPLPPHIQTKRLSAQRGHNVNPEKARYEWYDQLFGHQDLPFILDNAKIADDIMGMTGAPGGYTQKALHLYTKNPAAAAAEFGDNARAMLLIQAELGDEQVKNEPILAAHRANARFMLAHPWAAAGQTALEEFFNPQSAAEFAFVGAPLGYIAREALNASRQGRNILHFASSYREIVAQHGENARNMVWQIGARIQQADKIAKESVDKFFGGLTQSEQWEVVRQSQGSIPNVAHAAKRNDIAARAAALRNQIHFISLDKLKQGVLKPSQIKDAKIYFPMKEAAENPIYNQDTMSFLDALRPNVKYNAPVAESLHQAKYDTVDQAIARTVAPLDPTKINAATQYYKYVRASHQNLAFEQGLQDIAKKYPDMVRFGTMQGDRLVGPPPIDRWGRQMVNIDQALGGTPSPGLRSAWVSRELGDFFTRGKRSGAAKLTGWSDDAAIRGIHTAIEKLNTAQRSFIIANPGYHPFWNVAPSASAGTNAGIFESMRNYGRALVGVAFSVGDVAKHLPGGAGQVAGKVLDEAEKRFWVGSQAYAHDLADAVAAGAEAHFGSGLSSALGGDAIRLRTLAKSELTGPEKLDRFLADLMDWNSHATFGPRGEGQFVATMYKNRLARGLAPEDAAWETREALGHYQNVDPNSWQSKYILFYPWLKSNVAHFMWNFLGNPKLARAQIEGFHRQNEERGDPRIADSLNRRSPSQLYLGQDDRKRDVTYTPPFPWKDVEKVGEALAPGPRDLNERLQIGEEIIASRLKVVPSIVGNTFATMIGQAADRGKYQGFVTMYDKNAPGGEQAKQEALSVIERSGLYPAPFLVQDFMDKGFEADRVTDYISELAGTGIITRAQGAGATRMLKKLLNEYHAEVGRLYKRQQSSNPLEQTDFDAHKKFITDQYNTKVKRITDALQKHAATTKELPHRSDFDVPRKADFQ